MSEILQLQTCVSPNWTNGYNREYPLQKIVINFTSVRNRMYSPTLARWMQMDPAGYVDGLNLYAAFNGAPAELTDAWGKAARGPHPWAGHGSTGSEFNTHIANPEIGPGANPDAEFASIDVSWTEIRLSRVTLLESPGSADDMPWNDYRLPAGRIGDAIDWYGIAVDAVCDGHKWHAEGTIKYAGWILIDTTKLREIIA
jgi:RHS repeat-associated protein